MTIDMEARRATVHRHLAASPSSVFEVLTDNTLHPVIDGSGSVIAARTTGDHRLALGTRFGMRMRMGVPYLITNTVTEFEPDRLIAWRHLGHHVWRYELTPTDDGGTDVTETFDWSVARSPKAIELVGYPARHEPNMAATLERLHALLTNKSAALCPRSCLGGWRRSTSTARSPSATPWPASSPSWEAGGRWPGPRPA